MPPAPPAPPAPDLTARLDFARHLALEAQAFILDHYSPHVRFQSKADGTPVTAADVGAEELVRAHLAHNFPDDGILGEECGHQPPRAGSAFRWVIDPIDGTKSFIHGVPLFGTLLGIQHRAQPDDPMAIDGWRSVAGVARFPALDECIWGSLGGGAFHSSRHHAAPRPIRVSPVRTLAESAVSTTSPRAMLVPERRAFYIKVCEQANLSRGWSDCYGALLVATGQIEAMLEPPMKLWDVSALEPIIIEAGGRYTGLDGRPTDGSTGAIITNGLVHDELLALARATR
jgi:histidinol phosphatase-like enzyme (inositol monophosphatase family)